MNKDKSTVAIALAGFILGVGFGAVLVVICTIPSEFNRGVDSVRKEAAEQGKGRYVADPITGENSWEWGE